VVQSRRGVAVVVQSRSGFYTKLPASAYAYLGPEYTYHFLLLLQVEESTHRLHCLLNLGSAHAMVCAVKEAHACVHQSYGRLIFPFEV